MKIPAGERIGFLGAGQMAMALAKGFLEKGLVLPDQIVACDVVPAACQSFQLATKAGIAANAKEVLAQANIIILAVKPQHAGELVRSIAGDMTPRHLLVSIAAGTSIATLEGWLDQPARVVRVMPNTPALVGCGASGFAAGPNATAADSALVLQMLTSVGIACQVPERLLDAVTGLSGSGPAYAFVMIEALSDGGVQMGLPRDIATQLAAQTLLGAARMLLETGKHAGSLKDAVASPGGTTIAGLAVLEQQGLRGALIDAVRAATLRSQELGRT